MSKPLKVRVKAPFGEIIVEGENASEVLETIERLPTDFVDKINDMISAKFQPVVETQLEGIVEATTDGPVITIRRKITHYEAIGIILYASEGMTGTATNIDRLLKSSGIKAMVPARLNEMTKRGLVFKPDSAKPEFKLTMQGERWVEEVAQRLRGQGAN